MSPERAAEHSIPVVVLPLPCLEESRKDFHDELFACDQVNDGNYHGAKEHKGKISSILLSSQRAAEPCKAVVHPSDTCHDQLFACDQGDDGDYDDACSTKARYLASTTTQ